MALKRVRKSFDDTPAKGGRGDRRPSIRDQIQMVEFPKGAKFLTSRLYPGVVPVGLHKYPLFKKDGTPVMSDKTKKQSEIDKICLAFNPETGERDPDKHCPYCEADLYFKLEYYAEGIIREEVESEPAKHKPNKEELKTGFKDPENDGSWTPVRGHRFTSNTYKRLKALKQLNKVKIDGEKVPMSVDDEEHGCDVNMNFDPDGTGDGMYGLQRSDQCAITEEENSYLRWNIEAAVEAATEDEEEAQRNVDWYRKHSGNGGGDSAEADTAELGDTISLTTEDDDTYDGVVTKIDDKKVTIEDEDGDEHTFRWSAVEEYSITERAKKGGKGKAKGKKADDEDDDDTPPKGKAKAGAKGKKQPEPEEEEDDDGPLFKEGDRVKVTDLDDEEVVGVVTSVDNRSITIEDDDEEEHTFKLAKVEVALAPKAKAGAKGKKQPEPEPEEEEEEEGGDYLPNEGDRVTVLDADDEELVTGVVTSIDKRNAVIEDDDEEEHTFKLVKVSFKPAPKAKAKAGAKGKKQPEPEEEEEEDDDEYVPKNGDRVVVIDADDEEQVTGAITSLTKKQVVIEDEDGDEHTFKLASVTLKEAPKAKAKAGAKAGKAKKAEPDDDDDDDDTPPKGKKAPARPKTGRNFDFDD